MRGPKPKKNDSVWAPKPDLARFPLKFGEQGPKPYAGFPLQNWGPRRNPMPGFPLQGGLGRYVLNPKPNPETKPPPHANRNPRNRGEGGGGGVGGKFEPVYTRLYTHVCTVQKHARQGGKAFWPG